MLEADLNKIFNLIQDSIPFFTLILAKEEATVTNLLKKGKEVLKGVYIGMEDINI